jgi:acetyl esterase/lipase
MLGDPYPMKRLFLLGLAVLAAASLHAQEKPNYTRTEDVIYGRKFGTALTLDVFEPAKKNGAAVIYIVSGGFVSDHASINPKLYQPLLDRGYTVFAVVHGAQPRFLVPEIVEDLNRAIRFVRHNAGRWGVDPNKFGISGGSAGGHLSLMLGTRGGPGKADAKDPIDRESSAVQAVACFYPPSDLLNFSKPGELMWDHQSSPKAHTPGTSFSVKGATREGQHEIARELSPLLFVTAAMPPTLVIHGDADQMVPLYQSQMLEQRCREVGARFRLIVKPGGGHGWPQIEKDVVAFADWFDVYLRGMKPTN